MTASPDIKERIRDFYDTLSPHFRDLWGEHLHDGLYETGDETKEAAQEKLVAYLAAKAALPRGGRGLDIGCGMGATSVWLARELGCDMTGITLSETQISIAQEFAQREGVTAKFLQADADHVQFDEPFDFVWMVGVLGHLPNQHGFIEHSPRFLRPGGTFVLADWVVAPDIPPADFDRRVKPVIDGMLMPEIASFDDYETWFGEAGYTLKLSQDLTRETAKTWDEGLSITQAPKILKLALTLGRDALWLLSAIKGMREAMARGLIRYGVLVAEK